MTAGFDFREASSICMLSDGELSDACRAALDTLSAKETARVLQAISAEAALRLRDLRQGIERRTAKIPMPTRIFIDPQERLSAYRAACELLVLSEPLWQALHESLVSLSLLEEDFSCLRKEKERLAALLEEMKQRGATDRSVVRSMEQRYQRRAVRADRLFNEFTEKRAALRRLCVDIESDFLARMSKIADFENEGAACEPSGYVRLCAELCSVISSTESSMK